ncbi:MAG TPA: hypothetical protein VIH08_12035 [Blastococcus sp.]
MVAREWTAAHAATDAATQLFAVEIRAAFSRLRAPRIPEPRR